MRLASFRRVDDPSGTREVGLVLGTDDELRVHGFPVGTDMIELLAEDPVARETLADAAAATDGLTLQQVQLLPPVYPTAMRDFLSFEEHVDGMERGMGNPGAPTEWYDAPTFLFMAPHAVTGPFDDIALAPGTERFDFELELAVVICRDVHNASPEEARSAVGGYLVMNDWSARDLQSREMRLKMGPSKGKDFATTIGPWIVTPDEIDDARDADGFLDLAMSVSINGVPFGRDRSGHMGWSFEQLISYASRASWVKAGEVLASGTCAGGSLAESWGRNGTLSPPPLRDGDVVEMTIERLGTLRNRVVARQDEVPAVPAARRRVLGAVS